MLKMFQYLETKICPIGQNVSIPSKSLVYVFHNKIVKRFFIHSRVLTNIFIISFFYFPHLLMLSSILNQPFLHCFSDNIQQTNLSRIYQIFSFDKKTSLYKKIKANHIIILFIVLLLSKFCVAYRTHKIMICMNHL